MKTSIDHLPAEKQTELQEIVRVINQRFPHAELIVLFGSTARGDWVDHRYKENGTTFEYKSDFDILVVLDTENLAINHEKNKNWQRQIHNDSGVETPLSVIFHGIGYLNAEIEEGNYFFVDILNEGIMLYDSGKFQLATPKPLSPKERRNKAQMYFNEWFKDANEFNDINADIEKGYYKKAIFLLHQSTEKYFMCVLLVYTDYKPKIHDLDKLDKEACKLDARFKTIFPRTTPEEERLFTVLKKAYIDSRYKLNYSITKEDLEYLSGCVVKLRDLTEIACKEKIESFV